MIEIWKNIKKFEDYQVSNLGKVKSLKFGKEKIMSQKIDRKGYLCVNLCKNGKHKKFSVHRLVAEAFIPNPNNYPQVNHKDENKQNNFVYINEDGTVDLEKSNLEYCTNEYNHNYGTAIERAAEKIKGRTDIVEKRVAKLLKPIQQIDLGTGIVLKKWPSIVEVQRKLGYNQSCISNCLRGRTKTSYGYKWEYGA